MTKINNGALIQLHDVTKSYLMGNQELVVLDNINLRIEPQSLVAITGPSGSGKSTLLSLIAGLDSFSAGKILVDEQDIGNLSEDALAQFRSRNMGYIFQSFHLLGSLTVLENVMVSLELQRQSDVKSKASAMLERVGLEKRLGHYPIELSGGEQQRVAIARALVGKPRVLLADEPTGSLDKRNSRSIVALIKELHADLGLTVLIVCHDPEVAQETQRILEISDGRIVSNQQN